MLVTKVIEFIIGKLIVVKQMEANNEEF